MTTITIERELLVRIEKELFLARNYGGTLRDEPLLKKVSDVLALASEFDSIIEAIGDDPASATAPDEQIRKDAERYRWCVKNNLVLAGGTREFGWQIAPVGSEWNRYIDSAMKGTP